MLIDLLQKFTELKFTDTLAIYDVKLQTTNDGFHFEIELDGLLEKRGEVNIQMCSDFSRAFQATLDKALDSKDMEWCSILPDDITSENYSMEVSSAGVNRSLNIPQDLQRFKDLPIEIKYYKGESDKKNIIVSKDVFIYIDGEEKLIFKKYKKKIKKINNNKPKEDFDTKHTILTDFIIEIRLYLDF